MSHALPLVIAVTGHRDLVESECSGIREKVGQLLDDLVERYPERRLRVMSALAEGADRLVANVALEKSIELAVVLPMSRLEYLKDFSSEESQTEFEALCDKAIDVFELPPSRRGASCEIQYAQLGVFLSAHCHILLALWDGKPSADMGGTAQVVNFHHDDIMPGYTPKTVATQQMLVDDESDLVYHIVCSRNRPGGEPEKGLEPLECSWYTKHETDPRTADLPEQHDRVFRRSGEFSYDAMRFSSQIEAEKYSLLGDGDNPAPGLENINYVFGLADWLAIHYQKRVLLILRASHVLAFLMGFMFILYSDYDVGQLFLYAFLVFFFAAAGLHMLAKKRGWHRKYLDYRTLAEGLRVQFYWAAAGVSNENISKFTHDNFLQTQDPELGWIRNVMRVAGTRCDAMPEKTREGLAFALREWLEGQLSYYARKSAWRVSRQRFTERLGQLSLAVSAIVVFVFLIMGASLPDRFSDPLVIIMGTTLLLFGVRHGYSYSTAEKELIRQYDYMLRVFANAKLRIEHAADDDEKRQVLQALGGSALNEHAQWILMHRERSVDQGDVWLIGSGG